MADNDEPPVPYRPPTAPDFDPKDDPHITNPEKMGRRAKREGVDRESNPYIEDTPPYKEWAEGFDAED